MVSCAQFSAQIYTGPYGSYFVGNLMQVQDNLESWMRGLGALKMDSKAPLGLLSIFYPRQSFVLSIRAIGKP